MSFDFERSFARENQRAPEGSWSVWLILAGRGFGKTRTGAAWVHQRAMAHAGRWCALVARTPADARDYMIEGVGGILRNTDPRHCPLYEPSKRRLTWPNGSWATVYSDEEPDQLRGFSGDTAWLDELAKFRHPIETWTNLDFGMRETSNDQPRRVVTTTPRPIEIVKQIIADPHTIKTVGTSYENRLNLDKKWFDDIVRKYENTRIGRQELNAEILDDAPGALWTRSALDKCYIKETEMPEVVRVLIGVDPSGTSGDDDDRANSVGIVAVAKGVDGKAYVIADWTVSLSPAGWGRRVNELYSLYDANLVVAEKNFGGAMVEHVLRTVNPQLSLKMVTASKGKVARAEPVAALYEQGMVKHVGSFADLEDQMCSFLAEGYIGKGSPDRVDALVWAMHELMLKKFVEDTTELAVLSVGKDRNREATLRPSEDRSRVRVRDDDVLGIG